VGIHLVRLCLILELGFSDEAAGRAMPVISIGKDKFRWLAPPSSIGAMTAIDVWKTNNAKDHGQAVGAWARSAWQAWALYHEQIRLWVPMRLSDLA